LAANFLTADVDKEAVEVAARRARVVDFFWSDPDPALIELVHGHGAVAAWQVGSVEEARAAVAAGCDLLTAQGTEAGGHVRGDATLLALLGAVLDEVDVPVLAAGGIGTGRALAAVLAAGAAGARIGTRFIATAESGAHPDYKRAVVDAGLGASEITGAFALCPLCATRPRARVLSRCVQTVGEQPDGPVGQTRIGSQTIDLPKGHGMPPGAATSGRVHAMPMYASDSAVHVNGSETAAEVLAALATSAERQLDQMRPG
jgi:nitronate monooxygenase